MIIAYDLETAIMQRGYKRPQGLILEIGAYDIFLDRSFRCFVNPTEQKLTKENYLQVLEAEGARPYPTKTHAENIRYEPESALPLRVAMQQFLSFLQTAEVLCAHNGRSFDDKIVRGSLERCGLQWPSEMRFLDSYYDVSKKVWPGRRSYKLQVLHRALCPEASSLKWHTALDDSMGLAHLLGAAARHTVAENVELAAQYVEKDYGVSKLNSQFGAKFPRRLNDCIGRQTKEAVRQKLKSKRPSTKLTILCLDICIKAGLWKMR